MQASCIVCYGNGGGFIMPKYHKIIAQLKRKDVSNRQIAEMIGISRNTVNSTVNAIIRSGKSFYEVSLMTEDELNDVLRSMPNSSSRSSRESDFVMPDYERLKKELVKPGVTLQLLWEEYMDQCRLSGKKGYQLTQFKKHFNDALKKTEFKDILQHRAGEQIEVDWAGDRPHWTDPDTGEIIYGWLFGGILPFSGLSYVQITPDMKMESWIDCHVKMFRYFGGTAKILTPDNLKAGITKNTSSELIVNKTYQDMAEYYKMIVIPGRVRKPRDKNQVENLMLRMEQTIIGRLRNYQFFSIDEYNQAALKELKRFNNKPFQKKEGSRRELFEKYERATLQPLPVTDYRMALFKKAKVQSNSHIAYLKNYYSVPYEYIGKEVDLRITSDDIEVFDSNNLLSRHRLVKGRIGTYSTNAEHMPPGSNAYGEWNSTRYLNWAKTKGPHVYEVVYRIFSSTDIEQRYYRTVHSILKLADTYSDQRLDDSCHLALDEITRPMYRDIKHILETGRDRCQESHDDSESQPTLFTRGGDYFG